MVVAGGPDLGSGSLSDRRDRFGADFDWFRTALIDEPRGSEVAVGALLVPPVDPASAAGVIFFNNAGYLGMCGHGTIGVVVSLAHLGRIAGGTHRLETPVGPVTATLRPDGSVAFQNVESRCAQQGVTLSVPGYGPVTGDVAWGGNWFFLTEQSPVALVRSNIPALTSYTDAIQRTVDSIGLRGAGGGTIDHIEVCGPSDSGADSRNFVRCPGGMYDRSPCGTGTSARLAVLQARGAISPGQRWRQEGILGGVFEGSIELTPGGVRPTIAGRAYVTAEADLVLDDRDPFRNGIPP